MHARVTRIQGDPATFDEVVRTITGSIVPGAKKMPGFKAGYWLYDRTTGKGLALTVFESEAAMN